MEVTKCSFLHGRNFPSSAGQSERGIHVLLSRTILRNDRVLVASLREPPGSRSRRRQGRKNLLEAEGATALIRRAVNNGAISLSLSLSPSLVRARVRDDAAAPRAGRVVDRWRERKYVKRENQFSSERRRRICAGVLKKRRNRPLTIIGSRREPDAEVLLWLAQKATGNADSPSNKKINREPFGGRP